MTDASHRAAVAERAARAGGVVAREQFRGDLSVDSKANKNDLVTETDRDAQRQVVATIRAEFPDDRFLCEEDLSTRAGPEADREPEAVDSVPDSGSLWVIDPIDGTANYVRGMRLWGTAVSAIVDGEPVASVTYLPSYGDLYAAGPESGTRGGTELAVSGRTDPETFAVAPVGWWDRDDRDEFGRLCSAVGDRFGDIRRLGSFQATLAHVADGALEGLVCTRPMAPWDTLAGVHMVRQAGGMVTDLDGEPWTHDSDSVVASNGEAHEAFVAAGNEALRQN
ncbi:myo-inositol-1(or 4)-monophosphatase [Haloarcula quadrata]|jgi:myo-inositol-1(or 4)-monophosphatase|uniref:fructose-bisphosphatase n=2 Tax=Haloarcula TaxID=2237 RepID=A0A495R5X5_9EURY|nr:MULTISPECIES: inositol monophosphatase [Haloarcula]EMA11852.1 inositol-1-monophosphatase [Haloarcula californiae ATCC 33799]NHX38204.1 inositol monophosphatase [Haloarcula sp. R1-2]RKS82723.1 myo-inositol-1(or 4)-monophosphatase [Haloarcula quadrata]